MVMNDKSKKPLLNSLNFSQECFQTGFSSKLRESSNQKTKDPIKEFFNDRNKKKNYFNYIQVLKSDILALESSIKSYNEKLYLLVEGQAANFGQSSNNHLTPFVNKVNTSGKITTTYSKVRNLYDDSKVEGKVKDDLDNLTNSSSNLDVIFKKYEIHLKPEIIDKDVGELVKKLYLESMLNEMFFKKLSDLLLLEDLFFYGSIEEMVEKSQGESLSKVGRLMSFLDRKNGERNCICNFESPTKNNRGSLVKLDNKRIQSSFLNARSDYFGDKKNGNYEFNIFPTSVNKKNKLSKIQHSPNIRERPPSKFVLVNGGDNNDHKLNEEERENFDKFNVILGRRESSQNSLSIDFEKRPEASNNMTQITEKNDLSQTITLASNKELVDYIALSSSINDIIYYDSPSKEAHLKHFKRKFTDTTDKNSVFNHIMNHLRDIIIKCLEKIYNLYQESQEPCKSKIGKTGFLNATSYIDVFVKQLDEIKKETISTEVETKKLKNETFEKRIEVERLKIELDDCKNSIRELSLKNLQHEKVEFLNLNIKQTFELINQTTKFENKEKLSLAAQIEDLKVQANELQDKVGFLNNHIDETQKYLKSNKNNDYEDLLKDQFEKMRGGFMKKLEEKDWILRNQRVIYKQNLQKISEENERLRVIQDMFLKQTNSFNDMISKISDLNLVIT